MAFEITTTFLKQLIGFVDENKDSEIKKLFSEIHYADVAEILEELNVIFLL